MRDVLHALRLDEMKVTSGKGRILIMDDEEFVRQVAGDMLEYLGYDVDFATTTLRLSGNTKGPLIRAGPSMS